MASLKTWNHAIVNGGATIPRCIDDLIDKSEAAPDLLRDRAREDLTDSTAARNLREFDLMQAPSGSPTGLLRDAERHLIQAAILLDAVEQRMPSGTGFLRGTDHVEPVDSCEVLEAVHRLIDETDERLDR